MIIDRLALWNPSRYVGGESDCSGTGNEVGMKWDQSWSHRSAGIFIDGCRQRRCLSQAWEASIGIYVAQRFARRFRSAKRMFFHRYSPINSRCLLFLRSNFYFRYLCNPDGKFLLFIQCKIRITVGYASTTSHVKTTPFGAARVGLWGGVRSGRALRYN